MQAAPDERLPKWEMMGGPRACAREGRLVEKCLAEAPCGGGKAPETGATIRSGSSQRAPGCRAAVSRFGLHERGDSFFVITRLIIAEHGN